jgi:hypothetical protein
MRRYTLLVLLILLLIPSFADARALKKAITLTPPDVVIQGVQLSPSPARPGGEVTIELRIDNRGQMPITEVIEVRGEASPGNWSCTERVRGLAPGDRVSLRIHFPVPRGARGRISFLFSAFSAQEPVENRGNNSLRATLPIQGADEGRVGMVLEMKSGWIIEEILPHQGSTTQGSPFTFEIILRYRPGSLSQGVTVIPTPTIPGQKGWFELSPFQASRLNPQGEIRARVTITPTYQAPVGIHRFHTSITVPGHPPLIIKEGPRLLVVRARETVSLPSTVSQEVLVTVKGKSLRPLLDRLTRVYRLEVVDVKELGSLRRSLILLRITDGRSVGEVIKALSRDPYKITPQPNYIYRTSGVKADPLADLQFAFTSLNADRLPSGIDGRGVTIAVIDTGVDYLHPDLKGRIVQKKDLTGTNLFQHDLHGTALAGIIAAHCKNGLGICGLAPGAKIVAIKACQPIAEGRMAAITTSYWLAQGIDYAIVQKVQVINLSLGGPKDPLITEFIKEAFARDIVVVAAAGDKGLINYPPYPAALPEVIAVAAVDIKVKPYAEGIRGGFITLCAPGVDIMTTQPGDKYNFCTGTSMAAAYVTGAVALLLQKHPNLKPKEVCSLLENSAKDCGPAGRDKEFGCGLVDLKKLLD